MSLMAWHLASVIHSFSLLTCKCRVKKPKKYVFWGEMTCLNTQCANYLRQRLVRQQPGPLQDVAVLLRSLPPEGGLSMQKLEIRHLFAYLGIKFTSASSPPTWSPPSYPSTGGAAAAQAAAAASSERLRSSLSLAAASSASTCRWRAAALSEGLRTWF